MSQKAEPTNWLYRLQLAASRSNLSNTYYKIDYVGDSFENACAIAREVKKSIWEHKMFPGYFMVAEHPALELDKCMENWQKYNSEGEKIK